MINDTTQIDDNSLPDAHFKDLKLWAHVLGKGVCEFAKAELRRVHLENLMDKGEQAGVRLAQQVEGFHENRRNLQRLLQISQVRLDAKEKKAVQREIAAIRKLLASPVYEDVVVFLGHDEPTTWFWDKSCHIGSIVWIHSLFPSLPPLEDFRKKVTSDPGKLADSTL